MIAPGLPAVSLRSAFDTVSDVECVTPRSGSDTTERRGTTISSSICNDCMQLAHGFLCRQEEGTTHRHDERELP